MRLDDWQTNLSVLITERLETPYHIVDFNCLLWGCEAVKAVNGKDLYEPFSKRSTKNETGAAIIFRQLSGCKNTTDYLERELGKRQPLGLLKKGDLIVADINSPELNIVNGYDLFGPPIGVCYGAVSFFVGFDGLVKVHTLELEGETYGFYC